MARAKISYFSLWQIDPYAAKESAQSPKRIEKLLYKAAEFFVLKPQDILRLGKRMPISEAIINLSSQLGMNGKIISKEEIRRNDNLPIIAWHQLKKEISLLVPYSRGRFLIVNEKNNRGQLIHFDEIPQIFNNLMLLFVAEKNESRSMFELNNFIRRCVPLNLLALSSVIKIVVIFAFFFLCSRLFISASSLQFYVLGFGLTCLLGMIFVSDYLLIHCGGKNFVMASLMSFASFYERLFGMSSDIFAKQSAPSMLRLKENIFEDLNFFFFEQPQKLIYPMIIFANLWVWWFWHPALFFAILLLLPLALISRTFFKNKFASCAEKIEMIQEKQSHLIEAWESSFSMMVSLKGLSPLLVRLAGEWSALRQINLRLMRMRILAANIRILMPLLMLIFALIAFYWWPLKIGFLAMLLLLFDMPVLGFSLAELALGRGFIKPLSKSSINSLEKIPKLASALRVLPVHFNGTIELLNVSFSYAESSMAIIKNANLVIEAGRYYQILGNSGTGKSTLLKLMTGQVFPTHGQVLFDGQDVRSLKLDALRSHFGIVSQENHIFAGSIYENIVCGRMISQKVIERLLLSHEIFDLILDLPMALQTYVFLRAPNLSRAQIVVILIARALAHDPKIIFMDEIFKGIDAHEQKIISDFLASLPITRIIISHQHLSLPSCQAINIQSSTLKVVS